MSVSRKIMIVAGEASGDTHAAKLVNALRAAMPNVESEFFGCAGPKMRSAGVEAIVEADSLSVVGLAEIASSLPIFLSAYRTLKQATRTRRPDVVVLVDFPDFNLKLARTLKKQGCKVVYYISPQLWAWRKQRLSTVKRYIDLMLTILPFEKEWYEKNGFHRVRYVGSPLAREVHATLSREEFRKKYNFDQARPLIALLPGSREKEIDRILPVMNGAAELLLKDRSEIQFVLALNSSENNALSRPNGLRSMAGSVTVAGETYDALNAADAAAITSGTATLEAGIIGTPMVVVYRTSSTNYKLLAPMIDVPHYGLINLIAEKRLAAELIQDGLTPRRWPTSC